MLQWFSCPPDLQRNKDLQIRHECGIHSMNSNINNVWWLDFYIVTLAFLWSTGSFSFSDLIRCSIAAFVVMCVFFSQGRTQSAVTRLGR